MLIIYNETKITAVSITTFVSGLNRHTKIQSNRRKRNKNYLDLTVWRHLEIYMYKRPTAASTMIYFVSNHPMGQKMTASRYVLHRKYDLPLTEEKQKKKERELFLT
jgi:hypothetical protein